jgi:hypothetical protein
MMDLFLEAWVSGNIERAKAGWMLGAGKPWQPGERLKLLFAGYNGTRNMGSKRCCARYATFLVRSVSTSPR